jgi:hypothetical protein
LNILIEKGLIDEIEAASLIMNIGWSFLRDVSKNIGDQELNDRFLVSFFGCKIEEGKIRFTGKDEKKEMVKRIKEKLANYEV